MAITQNQIGPTVETCDGKDNDCNGLIDDGVGAPTIFYQDSDGDTYGDSAVSDVSCTAPAGFVIRGGDCDDTNSAVNPAAAELCGSGYGDGIDNNCNGVIDEGCAAYPVALFSDGGEYDSVQNAYDAIDPNTQNDTIMMQALELSGGLTFDQDYLVVLAGGYDNAFSSATGWTTISNPTGPALVIKNGTVIAEYVMLR